MAPLYERKLSEKTNKNSCRHWPSELTNNGSDRPIESRKNGNDSKEIESGMDTRNDRRMTENGPIYERKKDGGHGIGSITYCTLYKDGYDIHYE
jgi:hypothetical protein